MLKYVKSICGTVFAMVTVLMAPTIVSANEIALTFVNHDLEISGEFVDYQNDAYVLVTGAGEMIVPAAMVTCEGSDCVDGTLAETSGS